jgi:hypothetical protein
MIRFGSSRPKGVASRQGISIYIVPFYTPITFWRDGTCSGQGFGGETTSIQLRLRLRGYGWCCLNILLKQGLDEFRGVEFFQVIDSFSHANVSDWNFKLFCDSDNDSSLGCSIQFGKSDACHAHGLAEEFCL